MNAPSTPAFHQFLRFAACIAGAIAVSSCGDDPELVKKTQEQQAEITRLRGEVALIDEKLRNLPADKSSELAEAKKVAETQTAEIKALEEEIASLEARKKSIDEEFKAYQRKYSVR